MTRNRIAIALAGLAGIAVAAIITWSASQLVTQKIALTAEPLTAGSALLPASEHRTVPPTRPHAHRHKTGPAPSGRRVEPATAGAPGATPAPATAAPTAPATKAEPSGETTAEAEQRRQEAAAEAEQKRQEAAQEGRERATERSHHRDD